MGCNFVVGRAESAWREWPAIESAMGAVRSSAGCEDNGKECKEYGEVMHGRSFQMSLDIRTPAACNYSCSTCSRKV